MVILAVFLIVWRTHYISPIPLHLLLNAVIKQVCLLLVHESVIVN